MRRSNAGRHENVYFEAARVPSSSAVNRQPPPKFVKNHGPDTMVIPTFLGGAYETYWLTMASPRCDLVRVRTPFPGACAPSRKPWAEMKGSHLSRNSPVVCEKAKAVPGSMRIQRSARTWGMPQPNHADAGYLVIFANRARMI